MKRLKEIAQYAGCLLPFILFIPIFQWLYSISPWILFGPVIVFAGLALISTPLHKFRRCRSLEKKGFFVETIKDHQMLYEEQRGSEVVSLVLSTTIIENGRHHLVIPSKADWERSAPEWAKNRRDEICTRAMRFKPKDWVEFPADWPA